MYPRGQNKVEPTLIAHPQQYRNGSVYCERYINGLPRQKGFSSTQAQTRPVFQRQEVSHYYNSSTEFNSASGTDRSSSFLGQDYNGEETVEEKYSKAVGLRKGPEIHNYDYSSFYDQAHLEPSVNFYSHKIDVGEQDSPSGNHREFLERDNHRPYNALHGKEKMANQWFGDMTERATPLQSSIVIPGSINIQSRDWCQRTRRNSASSTGSDEVSPFQDSGDTDDNNDKYSQNRVLPPCRICGARASGFHYGVNSCEACKGFFRRALKRPVTFHCTRDNTCDIKGNRRSTCRFCRYKRCLRLGMSREAIKTGRYSHRKRTSDIIEVKQLESTPGFPIDEPDFDNVLNTLMAAHDAQESLKASTETEAAIHERQCEHIRLNYELRKIDRGDTDSAFTKVDENDVTTALTKDIIIANSTIITSTTTTSNSNSNNIKSEDGQFNEINNCSNTKSGYPNCGTASPSLSAASSDSGFNEDGLSPCVESEKGKMAFSFRGPLDLSLKRKRDNEDEEKSVARRGVDDINLNNSERSLTSLEQANCHPDFPEIPSLLDSRRSISEASVTCYDLADELVSSTGTDGTCDVRVVQGFLEDSDSSFITGNAQKRRKLESTDDAQDCFLKVSRCYGEQNGPQTAQAEHQRNKGDICHKKQCSRKASNSSECFFEQDSGIDHCKGNDVNERSGSWGSTVKGDQDGVALADKEHSENRNLEAAKKWVAGYINFAKAIPGFIDLPAQTKGVLLRQAWDEVWMLQAYNGYSRDLGVAMMPSGRVFLQDEMDKVWGKENTMAAFDVAYVIKKCRLTQEMLALLKAVCIVSPDRSDQKINSIN